MRVLVLGGSGTISSHIVDDLLAAGRTVTTLTRGRTPLAAGVERLVADRYDAASLASTLRGRSFDATVDLLCYEPEHGRILVEAVQDHGHLVLCSTVCALGFAHRTFPVPEDATPSATTAYGRDKALCEAWIVEHARRAGAPFTIVRPSTTFDERSGVLRQVRHDGVAWLARARAGRPIAIGDSGMGIHQFMHAEDAGRGFAAIIGNPAAHGRTYHLVGPPITWREHHLTVLGLLGSRSDLVGIPAAALNATAIPGDGLRREIFAFHGCFADRRLADEIGFVPRIPLEEALARTIAGLDAAGRIVRDPDESWEDRLIARWGTSP
jgi:nucleoside-diphosphate-sugar epimerase